LPDVPDPSRVMPTTRYVSKRGLPKNLNATDSSQVRPEHAHTPLVLMLVASQAAAGYWALLTIAYLIRVWSGNVVDLLDLQSTSTAGAFPWAALLGVVGVQGALALSLFHLGRPWLAWKAFLGWRRSWLSREVIAFTALAGTTGLFAVLALAEWFAIEYDRLALSTLLPPGRFADLFSSFRTVVAIAVLFSAWAAVYASAMVYRDTPRMLWATRATLWRFGLTAAICGIPAWLLMQQFLTELPAPWILAILPIAQLFKLLLESAVLRHRDDEDPNALWKAAQLLWGPFRKVRAVRGALGLIGGLVLPGAMLAGLIPSAGAFGVVALVAILLLVTTGELIERFFFFTTAVAPRMPGARL
jgi:formate dehydrogenase iron-sulfur subunit